MNVFQFAFLWGFQTSKQRCRQFQWPTRPRIHNACAAEKLVENNAGHVGHVVGPLPVVSGVTWGPYKWPYKNRWLMYCSCFFLAPKWVELIMTLLLKTGFGAHGVVGGSRFSLMMCCPATLPKTKQNVFENGPKLPKGSSPNHHLLRAMIVRIFYNCLAW